MIIKKTILIPILVLLTFAFVACTPEENNKRWTVTVQSSDNSMGYTSGTGVYDNNATATIQATPNDGFVFWKWNDGNDANPREIIVNRDMGFIAFFHRIGENPNDSVQYVDFNPNWVPGLWQKNGTSEFWRFKGDYTGVTWDPAEDIAEEESMNVFTWNVSGFTLTLMFGTFNGQEVIYEYFLQDQTHDVMVLSDKYGMKYTLYRVSQ